MAYKEMIERVLAPHFSGNNQPCMSGDPRDRLSAMQRRVCEDAATSVLEVLAALPQGEDVGGVAKKLRRPMATDNELLAAKMLEAQAAQIASLSAKVAEVGQIKEDWRRLCQQHEQTILDERTRASKLQREVERLRGKLNNAADTAYRMCAENRHVTLGDKLRAALQQEGKSDV